MKEIKLDSNRNPVIKNGNYEFVYDLDAVLQNCDNTMRVQAGEYNYDAAKGVDYLGNVFTGNPNFQRFEFQAREALEELEGVNRVESFDHSLVDNTLSYTAEISTIYGVGSINGNL